GGGGVGGAARGADPRGGPGSARRDGGAAGHRQALAHPGGGDWGPRRWNAGAQGTRVRIGEEVLVRGRPPAVRAVPSQALRGGTIRVSPWGSRALAPGLRARRADRRVGRRKLPVAAGRALLADGEHLYPRARAA